MSHSRTMYARLGTPYRNSDGGAGSPATSPALSPSAFSISFSNANRATLSARNCKSRVVSVVVRNRAPHSAPMARIAGPPARLIPSGKGGVKSGTVSCRGSDRPAPPTTKCPERPAARHFGRRSSESGRQSRPRSDLRALPARQHHWEHKIPCPVRPEPEPASARSAAARRAEAEALCPLRHSQPPRGPRP